MNLVEKARVFALAAHAAVKQVRKYTGEPYINHPAHVVQILQAHGVHQEEMLAAAWLHDVVEDTGVTIQDIEREFGLCVADMVAGLTDVSRPEHGNRAARKALDREWTASQSKACQTIKLADLISNTTSIRQYDPEFAKVYLVEKRLLLEVIGDAHPTLGNQARLLAS